MEYKIFGRGDIFKFKDTNKSVGFLLTNCEVGSGSGRNERPNISIGLEEEENIGLGLEDRKRRRSDLMIHAIMDTDDKLGAREKIDNNMSPKDAVFFEVD